MKLKKRKEYIRNQIQLKIEHFRTKKGIDFLNDCENNFNNVILDKNELNVLLIKLNWKRKVLLTTKNLFIIDNKNTTKIIGENIDRFDYMEFINGEKIIEGKSKLKIIFLRFKMNFRIGTYRIVEKNNTFIELKICRTKFADCLNGGIKKLKFVGNKYEGI